MGSYLCIPCRNSVGVILVKRHETEMIENVDPKGNAVEDSVDESPHIPSDGSKKWSEHIDGIIAQQRIAEKKSIKMLLLGGADAGKSTIVKHMRILHMHGFSDAEEIASCARNIRYNIFQIYSALAVGVLKRYPSVPYEEMASYLTFIKNFHNGRDQVDRFANDSLWLFKLSVNQEIDELQSIGRLSIIQRFLLENTNWPELPDNHAYFLLHLDRILSPGFAPNHDDILNLRVPTHAISEVHFAFSSSTIRLIDVGGQRSYRKKWIHCFEGVTAVLFVVSMASYDQNLEDVDPSSSPVHHSRIFEPASAAKKTNRLRDSAQLFTEMLRNPFLKKSAFILFLNKRDLFERKLVNSKLADSMHNYKGNNSFDDASEFIKNYFLKRKPKNDRGRPVYSHFTCATDTENVKFVFKAACDIVMLKNMHASGAQG